jgi:hypothetical protein
MDAKRVYFLNACGHGRRSLDDKVRINLGGELTVTLPGHCDDHASELARRFRGLQHVGRVTTRADGKQKVASLGEPLQLTREYTIVAVVVSDRSQSGCIGRESYGGQRSSLVKKAAYELRYEVLRIGCAAAIAASEDFVACGEASVERLHHASESLRQLARCASSDCSVLRKNISNRHVCNPL